MCGSVQTRVTPHATFKPSWLQRVMSFERPGSGRPSMNATLLAGV